MPLGLSEGSHLGYILHLCFMDSFPPLPSFHPFMSVPTKTVSFKVGRPGLCPLVILLIWVHKRFHIMTCVDQVQEFKVYFFFSLLGFLFVIRSRYNEK